MASRCPLRIVASPQGQSDDWKCLAEQCEWWTHDAGCAVKVLAVATVRQTMEQQRVAGEL